jgi:hypothetical protein
VRLAHDHQLDAVEAVGSQRRRSGEARMNRDRAQVGVEAERFSDCKQALLGAIRRPGLIPLRSADCAKENGIGTAGGRDGLRWERCAAGLERRPANERLGRVKRVSELLADGVEHPDALSHDLRPDAVARHHGYRRAHDQDRVTTCVAWVAS